ncbi:MAG: polysaccharide deacetylase family protein [Andreesenia angusta]|nr:polysaccharide deacetylase family protein [Andreesenia angusta]
MRKKLLFLLFASIVLISACKERDISFKKEIEPERNSEKIEIKPKEEKNEEDMEEEIEKDELAVQRAEFESKFDYSFEKYGDELSLNDSQNIPILIFHEIRKEYNGNIGVIISENALKEYLLYLKALKYQAISFNDYIEFKKGNKKIAKNSVIITFDDGYRSNYEIAYPILKELGMKATISIIGKYVDEAKDEDWSNKSLSYITWDNAKEMVDTGVIDIQNHTYDLHIDGDGVNQIRGVLGKKDDFDLRIEGRISGDNILFQQKMENYLGYKANVFTYPMGLNTDYIDSIYKKLGYEFRLGTDHGISDINSDKPLKRINTPVTAEPRAIIKELLRLRNQNNSLIFEDIENQEQRIKSLENYLGVELKDY